ncbi:uncharacterized protein LOC121711188 [Alosa sapidissima]|uniref:uncharacterized protein LOC121711188 n=1 Tax=Alosa sapidissima TaxID=34773 RepID=UPI001C08F2E8|nr:uncharacterized protein LOC121711188 [Alosa sapidissima]
MASIQCALMVLLICLSQDHMGRQYCDSPLHPEPFWCHAEGHDYEIHLSVLDEGGKELKNNSNDRARCKIQLTVELRDPNTTHTQRTWRCQITARGHVRTSATYTIRVKVPDSTPASLTDSSVPDSTASSTTSSVFPDVVLIAGVAASVSLLSAALLVVVVIHKRRTNARKEHRSSQSVSLIHSAIQSALPPVPSEEEEGADLHYAALQHLNPTPAGPSAKQSKDTVTYSAIEHFRSRVVDPDAVCTDVQKQNHKQNRTNAKMDSEDTVTYSAIKLHSSRTVGPDTVYATTQKDAMIQH